MYSHIRIDGETTVAIPSKQELELLHQNMCQAVADVKRMQIMYALHDQACHVTALADLLEMPQPTVSRHLAILKQRGIVTKERDGVTVVYRLTDDRIIDVLDTMRLLMRDTMLARTNLLDS